MGTRPRAALLGTEDHRVGGGAFHERVGPAPGSRAGAGVLRPAGTSHDPRALRGPGRWSRPCPRVAVSLGVLDRAPVTRGGGPHLPHGCLTPMALRSSGRCSPVSRPALASSACSSCGVVVGGSLIAACAQRPGSVCHDGDTTAGEARRGPAQPAASRRRAAGPRCEGSGQGVGHLAHAALLADTRRSGRPRGAHDQIIAATARSTRPIVLSADPLGFADLPAVERHRHC